MKSDYYEWVMAPDEDCQICELDDGSIMDIRKLGPYNFTARIKDRKGSIVASRTHGSLNAAKLWAQMYATTIYTSWENN